MRKHAGPGGAGRIGLALCGLWGSLAHAVVHVEVDEQDVPMVRSASVSFVDVAGEERPVEIRVVDGRTVIAIDGSADEVRGGELDIVPTDGTPRFSPVIPMDWDPIGGLELDPARQEITQAWPIELRSGLDPRWRFSIEVGQGEQEVAEWGAAGGIALAPGNEVRLLPVDEDRPTESLRVGIGTPPVFSSGPLAGLRLGFYYSAMEADDDGRAAVEAGGDNVFAVFDAEHPVLGTGIFGGPIGIQSSYAYDWDADQFEVSFTLPRDLDFLGGSRLTPRLSLAYGEEELDFRADDDFVALADLSVSTRRMLDNEYWEAQLGADWEKPLGRGFSVGLAAGLIYRDQQAKLESQTTVDLLGMPEGLVVRNKASNSDTGWYAGASVSYDVSDRVRVQARYETRRGVGNMSGTGPVDGDDVLAGQEARPGFENNGFSAQVGLQVSF